MKKKFIIVILLVLISFGIAYAAEFQIENITSTIFSVDDQGNTYIGGTLNVTGVLRAFSPSLFSDDVDITGDINVDTNAAIGGDIDITGDTDITGQLDVNGGAVVYVS